MSTLSSLSMTFKASVTGTGTENVTGSDYNALKQTLSINKNVGPFTTNNANNTALGANECYSAITTVAASGSVAIDMTSLTDILLQTGLTFARIKGYIIRLLSLADDSVNGTACTSVSINSTGSNLCPLPGITGATLGNGDVLMWATPTAAGTTVDSTHKIIEVVNNDSGHTAAVQITLVGGTT